MENLFAPIRRSQKELGAYERDIASQTQAMQNRLFTEQLADQRAQETREYTRQTQIDLEERARAEHDRRQENAEQAANRARDAEEKRADRAREGAARIARDVVEAKNEREDAQAIQAKEDADARAALVAATFAVKSGADPDRVNLLMAGVRGEVETGDMPEPDLFGAGRSPVPAPSRAAPRAGAAGGGRDVSKSILGLTKLGHDALKASVKSDRIEDEIHNLRKEIASLGGEEDIPARGKQGLPEYRDSLLKHFASQRKVVASKDAEDSAVRVKRMTAMTEGMPSWETATIGEINGWLAAHKITEADIAAQQMERISLKNKADSLQKRGEVIVVKDLKGKPVLPENWDDVPVSDIRDGVIGSFVNSHVASLKGRLDTKLDDWERIATKHSDLQGKGLTRSEVLTGWANTAILADGSLNPSNPLVQSGLSKASIEEIKKDPRRYKIVRANAAYRGKLDALDSAILASMKKAEEQWVADHNEKVKRGKATDAAIAANSVLSLHKAIILKEGTALSTQIQTFLGEDYTEGAPGTKLPYSTWLNRGPSIEIPSTSRSSVPAPSSVTGTPSTPKPTTGPDAVSRHLERQYSDAANIGVDAKSLNDMRGYIGGSKEELDKLSVAQITSEYIKASKKSNLDKATDVQKLLSSISSKSVYSIHDGRGGKRVDSINLVHQIGSIIDKYDTGRNLAGQKLLPHELERTIKLRGVGGSGAKDVTIRWDEETINKLRPIIKGIRRRQGYIEWADGILRNAPLTTPGDPLPHKDLIESRKDTSWVPLYRPAAPRLGPVPAPTAPAPMPTDYPPAQKRKHVFPTNELGLPTGPMIHEGIKGIAISDRATLLGMPWGAETPTKGVYKTWEEKYEKEGLPGGPNWVTPSYMFRGGYRDPRHGKYLPIESLQLQPMSEAGPMIPQSSKDLIESRKDIFSLPTPTPPVPPMVPPPVPTPDLSIPAPIPAPYNYPVNVPPPATDGITERYMMRPPWHEEYQAPPPPIPPPSYGPMIQPPLNIPSAPPTLDPSISPLGTEGMGPLRRSVPAPSPVAPMPGMNLMGPMRSQPYNPNRFIWDAQIGQLRLRTLEDHPTDPTTAGTGAIPTMPGLLPPYESPPRR